MDSAALDDPRTSSMKPLLLHCLLQIPPLKNTGAIAAISVTFFQNSFCKNNYADSVCWPTLEEHKNLKF